MSSLYRDMRRRLKECRTQEAVDSVVKAAHHCLDAKEFGRFLAHVLEHRGKLRERGEET